MNKEKQGFKLAFVIGFILIFIYLIVGLNIFSKDSLLGFFYYKGRKYRLWSMVYKFYNHFDGVLCSYILVFCIRGFFFGSRGFIYVITAGAISSIISFYIAKLFRKDIIKIVNKIYYRQKKGM